MIMLLLFHHSNSTSDTHFLALNCLCESFGHGLIGRPVSVLSTVCVVMENDLQMATVGPN